jgi:hypothetical protein
MLVSVYAHSDVVSWFKYIKPSPNADLSNANWITRVKINANSYLLNAENVLLRGLHNTIVAYEKYYCCLKSIRRSDVMEFDAQSCVNIVIGYLTLL